MKRLFQEIGASKMKCGTLPLRFQPEATTLPVSIPPHFERFYRENLRKVFGSRVRSSSIASEYRAWAEPLGLPSMSYVQLRGLLEMIGHRRVQSNGVHYLDVGFARDFPTVRDDLHIPIGATTRRPSTLSTADLLSAADDILAAALQLRRTILANEEQEQPHVAAQRALGLTSEGGVG